MDWTIGADRTSGLALLTNQDGWREEDLEELGEIVEVEFVVEERSTSLIQQAGWIPWLVFGLGVSFHPFFRAFFGEAGRDAYRALKAFLSRKVEDFQAEEEFGFARIHFNGQYRGITVSAAFNTRSHEALEAGLDQMDEALQLIDETVEGHANLDIEVMNVIYWEAEGRWVFNHALTSDGADLRGEYDPGLDEM